MTFLRYHVISQIPWIALLGLWSVFPPVWNLVEVRDWARILCGLQHPEQGHSWEVFGKH